MRSDSLNDKGNDSQLNDSRLNDSRLDESSISGSRGKTRKTLNDYEFVINENSKFKTSELGKGAYGTVKKVRDKTNGKIFAMKIMSKKAIFEYSNKENLKREISIQRKIHHPHVIRLYTCFEDSENVYLILEYAENGSLFHYLRGKKTLDEQEAFVFFFQTCLGIYYLHKKDIIHRDLKPENLLLDSEGNIKLCDFGWSADNYSKRHTFCGTIDYMAPEMIKNHPHDHRIDIWCLGILLYEMLHGRAPFKGRSDQEKTKNISTNAPIDFNPSISPDAVDLIRRILKPIPLERISMLEIFNHPWMKKYEQQLGIDLLSYIKEQEVVVKEPQNGSTASSSTQKDSIKEKRESDKRGNSGSTGVGGMESQSNIKESTPVTTTSMGATSNAKIIKIQDPTPMIIPNGKTAVDNSSNNKVVKSSEVLREDEKRDYNSNSRQHNYQRQNSNPTGSGGINIDQFLKDYRIDATPEIGILNRIEKFASNKSPTFENDPLTESKYNQKSNISGQGSYQSYSKPSWQESNRNEKSTGITEKQSVNAEYNPYAFQEGEDLDSFLRRIRSQNTGGSQSENPFRQAQGTYERREKYERLYESPQVTQGDYGDVNGLNKAYTANFGGKGNDYGRSKTMNYEDEVEPARMSKVSKRNVEIGNRGKSAEKKELNFFERILVGMGCIARDSKSHNNI